MLVGHPFVSDAKSEFMETTVDESSTTILPEASKEVEWMQISFDIPEPSYGCMLHDRPCSDSVASKDEDACEIIASKNLKRVEEW
ncbi:hypothetical protein RHMOL_Rhmol07G0163000 [Rhododendron molle]|uniref:Uncharacterized protein n=1 Tax=Rhododendron molle TaxID=49168 RepID=A0ACC0N2P5_RHOML|nr:hypothetical protein RHMOL_Rhmol07G0163000 [Rhododendron molle]